MNIELNNLSPLQTGLTRTRAERLARLVSNLFSPPLTGAVAGYLISRFSGSPGALEWMALYIAIAFGIPAFYVAYQVRRGKITDFHMVVRSQRLRPMILILICCLVSWLILWLGSAPQLLVVTTGLGVLFAAFMLVSTLRWKISGHAAAITGLATLLVAFYGKPAIPSVLAIPLVCWARLRLKRHSLPQILAGSIIGVGFVLVALWTNHLLD